jgi:hypothetical protein
MMDFGIPVVSWEEQHTGLGLNLLDGQARQGVWKEAGHTMRWQGGVEE